MSTHETKPTVLPAAFRIVATTRDGKEHVSTVVDGTQFTDEEATEAATAMMPLFEDSSAGWRFNTDTGFTLLRCADIVSIRTVRASHEYE